MSMFDYVTVEDLGMLPERPPWFPNDADGGAADVGTGSFQTKDLDLNLVDYVITRAGDLVARRGRILIGDTWTDVVDHPVKHTGDVGLFAIRRRRPRGSEHDFYDVTVTFVDGKATAWKRNAEMSF